MTLKVSIIVPYRNQLAYLGECIASCCRQSYKNIEIIVIDDASDVSPETLLAAFGNRVLLERLSEQRGPAYARNLGISLAKGDVIQFLDADDVIHPRKLEIQLRVMETFRSDLVISTWRQLFDVGVNLWMPSKELPSEDMLLAETIADAGHWFPVMGCLIRSEYVRAIGPWREELPCAEDREYRYRLLKGRPRISMTSDSLFSHRRTVHPSRSRTLAYQADTSAMTNTVDIDFINMIIADYRGGAVDPAPLAFGLPFQLARLEQRILYSSAFEVGRLESVCRQLRLVLSDIGVDAFDEERASALLSRPKKRSSIHRLIKSKLNPVLWTRLSLYYFYWKTWLSSWMIVFAIAVERRSKKYFATKRPWSLYKYLHENLRTWSLAQTASYATKCLLSADESQALHFVRDLARRTSTKEFSSALDAAPYKVKEHFPIELPSSSFDAEQRSRKSSYRELLTGKRVVLVGPAQHTIGLKKGAEIESFDLVVRLNFQWPVAKDVESDLGSRMDILYHCCNGDFPIERLLVPELRNAKFVLAEQGVHSRRLARHCDGIGVPCLYTSDLYHELKNKLGAPPSTGLIALTDILSHDVSELRVIGMTFGRTSYYPGYLGRGAQGGVWQHDFSAEAKLVKELAKGDFRLRFDEISADALRLK